MSGNTKSPRASLELKQSKQFSDGRDPRNLPSPKYSSGSSKKESPHRGNGIALFQKKGGRNDRQMDLSKKLQIIKKEANFLKEQHYVRDGVPLYIYVKHQGFDRTGKLLPSDGTAFPGDNTRKSKTQANLNTSAFVRRQDIEFDPADVSSSSNEDDDINMDDDAEESNKVHLHVFTVDLIVRYPDFQDEIFLHWGISRK